METKDCFSWGGGKGKIFTYPLKTKYNNNKQVNYVPPIVEKDIFSASYRYV